MRKTLLGISAAAILVFTAGCGDDAGSPASHQSTTPAPTTASTEHNEADITFAQQMIPHHQQAVDMAKMAAEKATDQKVKDLASRIEGAQDPEIQQLTGMLQKWGAPTEPSDMPGMDHGTDGGMNGMGHGEGMMTDDQMAQLEQATGADFDKMWLQMMIQHHQGAVTMAKTELEQGSSAEAKALAKKIVSAQEAEITEMQGMVS